MSGKISNLDVIRPASRKPLTLSTIEDLVRKGFNYRQIGDMHGVTRQAVEWQVKTYGGRLNTRQQVKELWPFETKVIHSKSKSYQRLRDHGEYMRQLSFKGFSEEKKKRLIAWWKMLLDQNVVLEFDPNIEPYPGMAGGGFRYVPRTDEDEDLLIRVNEHVRPEILDEDGTLNAKAESLWTWPQGIEDLIDP
ncbi:immunity repressor [Mycobacterium phage Equemioh13]|uniref:transcriptional repressor n=1 Tax=Mycobacterium phage Equemioh13 TaxID=1555201 RepID=UPI00051AA092|nr:transcriptional repressor [Mycobacterium phage Equemioh13]AIT13391.1 immunity repressor [Mycobacterium phage Equemioh13]AOZ64018.1 immunity repressor [Mycobacterium phage Baehexic]ATN92320.1 immunity repressor [Mycobacterium phage Updawg]QDM57277.1 immunity repressor [Mycobacterium phage WideWale]